MHRTACFLTGHPVDVATGRVLTSATDFALPGPLPLTFERSYDSSMSFRDGPLGPGWSHSLHQAVWTERGKVVYRAEDGREIECHVHDRPGRVLGVGQSAYQPVDRLTFKNLGDGTWEVETHDGITHVFGLVPGRTGESPLLHKRTRDGHAIDLFYDAQGRLEWVRDAGGRLVGFEHDTRNKLSSVKLPMPKERGWYQYRRFAYDQRGDLIEVKDSLGKSWRFEYDGHLLVQETDRNGLSFYFQYDGRGPGAWCVRTWGDGGIYDHVIDYDKPNRRTVVTNSLGAVTQYDLDENRLVVKVTDALGHATCYEYDDRSLQHTAEIDALGNTTHTTYDSRGNVVSVAGPDGSTVKLEYSERFNEPVRAVDAGGGVWRWDLDSLGHVISRTLPTGEVTRFRWEDGLLRAIEAPLERTTSFDYDEQKNVSTARLPNGAAMTYRRDSQGRVVELRDARGSVARTVYDLEGRALEATSPVGVVQRMAYDAEGFLVEAQDATRHMRLRYGHFHRVVEREEAGTKIELVYDTEDQLTAVVNEAGERFEYMLDALGNVAAETGFDGFKRVHFRDELGRIKQTLLPSGRKTSYGFDIVSRVTEVKHSDGTSSHFEYGLDGSLVRAVNDDAEVRFERDTLGRLIAETVGDVTVVSRYGADGARSLLESSLGARQAIVTDALGEVASLHHGRGAIHSDIPVMRFERDAMGLETARDLPGGIRMDWRRDALGRPLERRTLRTEPRTHPVELNTQAYVWRGEDQIAAIIDAARGPRSFDHDARGRLIGERQPGPSPISGDETLHRAMDAVGNVYRSPQLDDRRYGPGGRLEVADGTRYEHDEDGNLVERVDPDGSAWTYRWNGAGMLAEVERPDGTHIAFEYDAFARRTKKVIFTNDESALEGPKDPKARRLLDLPPGEPPRIIETETRYVWDGHTVLHELSSNDGLTTWYWEPGSFTTVSKERAGRLWSFCCDHLGTPTELYGTDGEIGWQARLNASGDPVIEVGDSYACPWRWPGQFADEETGLFYNRLRFYDPRLGRYISQDPLRVAAGLEPYSYVGDPEMWIDPFGLLWVYALVNAANEVYYVGRVSDSTTPSMVQSRHARIVGSDGPRFIRGSDSFVPLTSTGLSYHEARGLEQMGILGLTREGVIGRGITPGSTLPRRRGNNDPGIRWGNANYDRYMTSSRRYLDREGLEIIQDLYERAQINGGC